MKMPHEYRRTVEGHCHQCGVPITGLITKRWCSESCKQKAKYRRNKSTARIKYKSTPIHEGDTVTLESPLVKVNRSKQK